MPEPGVVALNGREYLVEAGGRFSGGASDDDIQMVFAPFGDLVRLNGGRGNDRFFGDPSDIFGGGGNDTVYSFGAEPSAGLPAVPNVVYGGRGDDLILDFYGSTDAYGGAGNDLFSTRQLMGGYVGINHSYRGDIDRTWLGDGEDTAIVAFNTISTPDLGMILEDRIVAVDGGNGIDRLILIEGSFDERLVVGARGLIDLTVQGGAEPLYIGNAVATGFESFDLRIGLGDFASLKTGAFDDRIEVLGTIYDDIPEQHDYLFRLGSGNDLFVGNTWATNEKVLGEGGDDVLISNGTGGHDRDILSGGQGDDLLVSFAFNVARLNVTMRGGAGHDIFMIGNGYSADQVILDFAAGEDRIVFNEGRVWNYDHDTPQATIRAALHPAADLETVLDTSEALEFVIDGAFRRSVDLQVRYDRTDGSLSMRQGEGAAEPWVRIGMVSGAPDLRLEDFSFL